ncbi:MAG: hypothetical protein MRJ52_02085 [Nitrosomonas sp.]|nr:hypothetical protein [Nitrosomonas sp.]
MTTRLFTIFILALTLLMLAVTTAWAENCETIRFQRGHSSAAIEGVAPPDSALCYQITTAAGQTADIAISGVNMMFSIEGVTDAQDKYRFTTEKKTYRITVSQLMRSVTNEPFTLTVAIE